MCQKLQIFLKENKANFLVKYDSIRKTNKYTVMLFDTEKKERISGGDTNSIVETEQNMRNEINKNIDFEDINNLFDKIRNSINVEFNHVVMLSINYSHGILDYVIYIDEPKNTSHNKFHSYEELEGFVKKNYG
ncbi:hypothetical protein ACWOFR_14710 [Carnobacterium gallinarum]|uniref:hypothetical protein n=1 Tax=Carnobacterium gallinarum TaxID=2749 RepID=UPI0005526393|nr:hypothetical protein [Carnobacterium gallinarum]